MALKFGIMPAELKSFDGNGLPVWDDRAVDEEYFARYHSELVNNGISAKITSSFQVMARTGMTLTVKPGAIFINGYFAYDADESIITIPAASPGGSRVDRVVMRLDKPNRKMSIIVLQGTAGSSAAPSLTRNTDVYDMGLCTVSINRDTTAISQANITDTRFVTDVCGVVSNYLGDIDTTDLFAQYNTEFREWFERMKGTLDEDSAGKLQNQIDSISTNLKTTSEVAAAANTTANVANDAAIKANDAIKFQLGDITILLGSNTFKGRGDEWIQIFDKVLEKFPGYPCILVSNGDSYTNETPIIGVNINPKTNLAWVRMASKIPVGQLVRVNYTVIYRQPK